MDVWDGGGDGRGGHARRPSSALLPGNRVSMAGAIMLNRNEISPMTMTAHCDVLRSPPQRARSRFCAHTKRNGTPQRREPDLNDRQKRAGREKKTRVDIRKERKKKPRRSAVTASGRRRGAVWPWNGRPCRISRWRRISLAPADTMQICCVSSHAPYLTPARFPDSPIPHTSPQSMQDDVPRPSLLSAFSMAMGIPVHRPWCIRGHPVAVRLG